MISGWGYRVEGDPTTVSDVLQFTTLTVFPNVRCEDTYGKWFKEGMFCAGIVNGGRDACESNYIHEVTDYFFVATRKKTLKICS